jgi:hypothetical protein
MGLACGIPQDDESRGRKHIRAGVKKSVEHRIKFEILQAVGGITRTRCHVVPLQYLVENNSVEESSKAETEENASQHGELFELFSQRFTLLVILGDVCGN